MLMVVFWICTHTQQYISHVRLRFHSFHFLTYQNRLHLTPSYVDTSPCGTLTTDASGWAIGGNLQQLGTNGIWQPVAFYSRKLTPAEVNYPVHDKEILAVYACSKAWRSYLIGIPFEVHTDHRNLVYFQQKQTLVERQRRWTHELSEFDFKLIHKPGTSQIISDTLSRRDQDLLKDITDERLQTRVH